MRQFRRDFYLVVAECVLIAVGASTVLADDQLGISEIRPEEEQASTSAGQPTSTDQPSTLAVRSETVVSEQQALPAPQAATPAAAPAAESKPVKLPVARLPFRRSDTSATKVTRALAEPQVTNQTRQALAFYGGNSARATLSQFPRRSSIQAGPQQPMRKTDQAVHHRPPRSDDQSVFESLPRRERHGKRHELLRPSSARKWSRSKPTAPAGRNSTAHAAIAEPLADAEGAAGTRRRAVPTKHARPLHGHGPILRRLGTLRERTPLAPREGIQCCRLALREENHHAERDEYTVRRPLLPAGPQQLFLPASRQAAKTVLVSRAAPNSRGSYVSASWPLAYRHSLPARRRIHLTFHRAGSSRWRLRVCRRNVVQRPQRGR